MNDHPNNCLAMYYRCTRLLRSGQRTVLLNGRKQPSHLICQHLIFKAGSASVPLDAEITWKTARLSLHAIRKNCKVNTSVATGNADLHRYIWQSLRWPARPVLTVALLTKSRHALSHAPCKIIGRNEKHVPFTAFTSRPLQQFRLVKAGQKKNRGIPRSWTVTYHALLRPPLAKVETALHHRSADRPSASIRNLEAQSGLRKQAGRLAISLAGQTSERCTQNTQLSPDLLSSSSIIDAISVASVIAIIIIIIINKQFRFFMKQQAAADGSQAMRGTREKQSAFVSQLSFGRVEFSRRFRI